MKTTHKAPYSTELCLKLINMYSTEGMTVLDPFMGLGTTGLACKQLNRKFIGIELYETHFKTAEERIKEHIKNKPKIELRNKSKIELRNKPKIQTRKLI